MIRPFTTVGQIYRDQFAVYEPDGVTKVSGQTLAAGHFVVSVWRNGVVYAGPAAVSITEIGVSGEYVLSIVPDDLGYWKVQVYVTYQALNLDVEFDSRPPTTVGQVALVGQIYRNQFAVYQTDGVTKVSGQTLAAGHFVVSTWRNGAVYAGPAVVAITEIGVSGEYVLSITPDTPGYWKVQVYVAYELLNLDIEFVAFVEGAENNDESIEPVEAVLGRQVRLTWYEEDSDGNPWTGLLLASYTVRSVSNGAVLATPTTTLGVVFSEVSAASAPGEYQVLLTPTEEGTLLFRLDRGTRRLRWVIRVARRGLIDLSSAMVAGSARVAITAKTAALVPIEGVLVKIYDSTGALQQVRGLTDATGTFQADLAPGTYRVYLSKTGYSFTTSGSSIVVPEGAEEAPVLDLRLPASVTAGQTLVLSGRFFHLTTASNTVVFNDGDDNTVAAAAVDALGHLLLVTVPAGLTPGSVNVSVRKPHPTSGTLTSNVLTVTVT